MANSDIWNLLSDRLTVRTEYRFPELPFENGTLIPTVADLPAGRDEVNSVFLDGGLGEEAILLAPGAADIPLTALTLGNEKIPVAMAAKGYSLGWQQKRGMDALNLTQTFSDLSIDLVRKEIAKRLNRFAAIGEPVLGQTGLYTNSKVSVTNSSFNPNSATFDQWVEFLVTTILNAGLSADGETIMQPTTVLMPPKMMVKAQSVTNATDTKTSAIQAAGQRLGINIGADYFVRSPYGASAILEKYSAMPSGTNKDRIVVYAKSDTVLSRRVENPIAQLVDEDFLAPTQGLTRIFPFFSCSSATQIHDPAGVKYIDVTKVT